MGETTETKHPCDYCGTMLDEDDCVMSDAPAVNGPMLHSATQCREYVYAALGSYKREVVDLRAKLAAAEARLAVAERVCRGVVEVMVDLGQHCIMCSEGIEADDDPCEPDCSGWETRKAVTAWRALSPSAPPEPAWDAAVVGRIVRAAVALRDRLSDDDRCDEEQIDLLREVDALPPSLLEAARKAGG